MFFERGANVRSLYLHWPFCPYRCKFCPFVALASQDHFMEKYHIALTKEIELFTQYIDHKILLDTIFIGGGTPSTYPDNLLLDMSDKLKEKFDINGDTEVTIEVNPGTVEPHQLILWKDIGINRLSIGVQSLNSSVLQRLNRLHSAEDVRRLIVQAAGIFENISVDLILGLPGVVVAEWKDLLTEVVTWPLKHLSIYFLTLHEDTRLYFEVKKKKLELPTDDSLVQLYHWSIDFLGRYGFEQYETSNFARQGYKCKHNVACWNRKPYKGFGLGACSFDGKSRFQNDKKLISYLDCANNGVSVIEFAEKLTREQVYLEKIMLGLRTSRGVALSTLFSDISEEQKNRLIQNISWLKSNNYLQEKGDRLVLTPAALVVQNEVAVKLSM